MVRPRTPTKILEMRGAYKNHPERGKDRVDEPKIKEGLGNPPRSLNSTQKKIWKELAAPMPAGVLTVADRSLMEIASVLMATFRDGEATAAQTAQLMKCLTEMGMTPASRSKVTVPKADKVDKWDD